MKEQRIKGLLIVTMLAVSSAASAGSLATASSPNAGLIILGPDQSKGQAKPMSEATAQRLHELYLLGMKNPSHFSYPWVDPATGEVVIDVTSDIGNRLAHAFQPGKKSATATQRIRAVKRSWAQLEMVRDDIVHLATPGMAPGQESIVAIEPDGPNNRLVVTVDRLNNDLLQALVGLFGTEAIAVRYDPNHQRPVPQARENDTSSGGFYGGANLNGCTSGFPWISGSTYYMVTAGHCFPSGGNASTPAEYMGWVTSGSRENWNSGTGTVFLPNESVYRGDIALVQVQSPKQVAGRIYRGGYNSSSSGPVKGMWSRQAATGDQYCSGGRVTGEQCGWSVTRVRFDIRYSTGEWARNINEGKKQAQCTKGGDSGGPVYTVRSDGGIVAKGIHTAGAGGGSDQWGGYLDPCYEYFTDIWQAYYGFPGVLRTE